MAKVPFTKLGLNKNKENIKTFVWNEQTIEVKQYLPVNDKLSLIGNVITLAHDGSNNFSNPIQLEVYTGLEILYFYTNINFTEKQKEDPAKLYDLVKSGELLEEVIKNIPEKEYNYIINGIEKTSKAIYDYQNSILGVLDTVKADYSNLDFDATAIQKKLADPEAMELLKGILSNLG